MKTYLWNLLIALDQLANVLLAGHADETLSARAYRTAKDGRWPGVLFRPLIDGLFFVLTLGRDDQHCRDSYVSERDRRHLHPHYRGVSCGSD